MSGKNTRVHVIISGKVQGVFFRAETQKAARGYNVCGWVRNKKDGSVEAVFEGSKTDVSLILEWCKTGSPFSEVTNIDVKREDFQGEFPDFNITY